MKNCFPSSPKNQNFSKSFYFMFWGSQTVVGGWNFVSAELSTSQTRQSARTMRKLEFFDEFPRKLSRSPPTLLIVSQAPCNAAYSLVSSMQCHVKSMNITR